MLTYFAHEGTEHATDSESLTHVLKQDGLKIILITVVALVLLFIVLKLVSGNNEPKKHKAKQPVKEEDETDE